MPLLKQHQLPDRYYSSMREEELTGIWKLLNSQAFFIIMTVLLLVFLSSFTRDFSQKRNIDNEVQSLQNEIKLLEDKHTYELSLINYYDSEEFLALEAKSVLDMKLPGEKVVVLTEGEVEKILMGELPFELQKNENNDNSTLNVQNSTTDSVSRWQSQGRLWWGYFFD
ncbi:MAG TPA: hypothetical protein PL066_03030 [bacterium]|nr:hypothetical protein [bacterium]